MGAFIISDIGFKSAKDRRKFEKKYKWIKKENILVDQNSNNYGFIAYQMMRDITIDVIYYMGFLGYAEPEKMLKECLKDGIKIKFWSWIPINDRNAKWEKIRGKW